MLKADGTNQGRIGQTPPAVHARADLNNTNTLPDTFTLDHGGGCEALAASHVNAVPARVKHAPAKPENAEPICAACHQPAPACDHADAIFAGVVAIDTISESGSWQRHRDDTLCMRGGQVDAFHHSTEIDRG